METNLYQEQTEIGGGAGLDAEARAADVGRRIREVVKTGVTLRRGLYVLSDLGGYCQACALGALALSLDAGANEKINTMNACPPAACRKIVTQLITWQEADQLELGFEAGHSPMYWVTSAPNRKSPFYRLGRELSESL